MTKKIENTLISLIKRKFENGKIDVVLLDDKKKIKAL